MTLQCLLYKEFNTLEGKLVPELSAIMKFAVTTSQQLLDKYIGAFHNVDAFKNNIKVSKSINPLINWRGQYIVLGIETDLGCSRKFFKEEKKEIVFILCLFKLCRAQW